MTKKKSFTQQTLVLATVILALVFFANSAFASAPTTSFASFQVPNTSDQNITLTCTKADSNCALLYYSINSGAWTQLNYTGKNAISELGKYLPYTNNPLDNNVTDLNGFFTFTNNNVTFTTEAVFGSHSAVFNGTNAYLLSQSRAFGSTRALSVSMWIAPRTVSNGETILYKQRDGACYIAYSISFDANGALRFWDDYGASSRRTFDTNFIPDMNKWSHIGFTRATDGSLTWFLNGTKMNSMGAAAGTTADNSYPTVLGSGYCNASVGDYFDGNIDDIGIWPYVISDANMKSIYESKGTSTRTTSSILYSGVGLHSIRYYSTALDGSIESTKTSAFSTYGTGHFRFYDENTGLALNGVTLTSTNGDNNTLSGNSWDANFQNLTGTTNTTYTFTKTGYGTRQYQLDLNQYADFNKQILLLPSTLGQDVDLTVFSPTLALLPNTYIELYKPDRNNMTTERLLTNSTGQTTINISLTDTNYWVMINQGQYTYYPILLTVNKPKNELTGADINTILDPFNVTITGPNFGSYTNRTSAVTAYLLTNTTNAYIIEVSDSNGVYFPRYYQKIFEGNPLSFTITPYLLSYVSGISVKIATYQQNSLLVTPYPNVRCDIYKSTGYGNVLIETKITDAKGEALSILNPGDAYLFNVYTLDTNNIATPISFNGSTTVPISATGATVALIITKSNVTNLDANYYGYQPVFDESFFTLQGIGIGDVNFTINNLGGRYYQLKYSWDVNGTQIGPEITKYSVDLNAVYDTNFNWSLVPASATFINLNLTLLDITTYNQYIYKKTYPIAPSGTVNIVDLFRNDVRNEIFTCQVGSWCLGSAIAWFIISFVIMVILFVRSGFGLIANPFAFVALMGMGTFLNWVPIEITAIIALGAVGLFLVGKYG